jgi:5-methyltetrahydropteroyltriglutamate--homocysteine methyltransferase
VEITEGAPTSQHAKLDATLLWIKAQEDAGLDTVIGDGEQSRDSTSCTASSRRSSGIDFEHKVEMGIRNDRYKAMVPQVVAPRWP